MNSTKLRFFLRMFSSAILLQALLSAASLCVAMILIRNATDAEYGYYVLITNAILLLSSLQNAYIQPSIIIKLNIGDVGVQERGTFVGSLYREQRKLLPVVAAVGIFVAGLLWYTGVIETSLLAVVVAGTAAVVATLYREFFRMVLLAYRRPNDVVRGDFVYVLVLVAGTWFVAKSETPAAGTAGVLMLAALVGGTLQRGSLWRFESWNNIGPKGALRSIVVVGLWAMIGAGIHWTLAQGYNYLVAGVLGVNAVATIAATRILMMPVNLLSTGIGSFMFPTVANWLQHHSVATVFRRLLLFAAGLGTAATLYLGVLWLLRDWIFVRILHKEFAQRDTLLALWSVICLMMVGRDQLSFVLVAKAHFRALAVVALLSAVLSLTVSYLAMQRIGEPGALIGIIVGEVISLAGIVFLTIRVAARPDSRH